MKIFVHIGMPKAGSSSIQRTLRDNEGVLRDRGVFYPHRSDFLYSLATGDGPVHAPVVPDGCDTVIFSDERLLHRVRDTASAAGLADALAAYSNDITIVCYLRREDEVFVSSYFTLLLMGSSMRLEERPLNPIKAYKRLRAWDSAFGRPNIVLRRFGASYLPNGIVPDFLELVGLDQAGITEAARANVSPRTDVLEIIRSINERRTETNRFALKAIAATGGQGERVGLSADKRKELVKMVEDGTTKLSRIYFNGEPLFIHPFVDDANAPVCLSPHDVARVGEEIARAHGAPAGSAPKDLTESLNWLYELALRSVRPQRDEPAR